MIVVCAGAKIVLDLPATREWLETHGVTVLGYECDEFPGFYTRTTGLAVDSRVNSPKNVAAVSKQRDELELESSVLVTVPVPFEHEMDAGELDSLIEDAHRSARQEGIAGKEITPYLLMKLARATDAKSVETNKALLINNAKVAAEISKSLH